MGLSLGGQGSYTQHSPTPFSLKPVHCVCYGAHRFYGVLDIDDANRHGRAMKLESFWSQQAIEDVNAALRMEEEWSPEALRGDFVAMLNYGWSNNTDKPYWTLAWLLATVGHAERTTLWPEPMGPFALIGHSSQPIMTLVAQLGENDPFCACRNSVIEINTQNGVVRIGLRKLKLLRLLSNFMLFCEGGDNSDAVLTMFGGLAQTDLRQGDVIKPQSNACAAFMRKYWDKHTNVDMSRRHLRLLVQYVEEAGGEFDEDTPLNLWMSGQKSDFKTYAMCFEKVAVLHAACQRAVGESVGFEPFHGDERQYAEWMARERDDDDAPEAGNETNAHLGFLMGVQDEAGPILELAEPVELPASAYDPRWNDVITELQSAPAKLLSGSQHRVVDQLLRAGAYGQLFPRALLRQLVLMPVQSKLSKDRKSAKLDATRLDDRLRQGPDQTYQEMMQIVETIETRLEALCAAAIVCLSPTMAQAPGANPRTQSLERQGIAVLASLKPRRGQSPESVEQVAWSGLFPIIAAGLSACQTFRLATQKAVCGAPHLSETLSGWYEADWDVFETFLRDQYSEPEAT